MNSLIGIWLYASLIYQGQPMPRPNPDLMMYFTFESNHINEIFYYNVSEKGFCKRKAEYSIEGHTLIQKVISVDEANADNCSQDPDMQIGHTSETPFDVDGNKFYLHLSLADDTLTYVWEKADSASIK